MATVHLGPHSMPWSFFEKFLREVPLVAPEFHGASTDEALREKVLRLTKISPIDHFATQLIRTLHRSASDPRDKVYGILGISTFTGVPLKPDYTKPTHQVFTEAVAAIILDARFDFSYSTPIQTPLHAATKDRRTLHFHRLGYQIFPLKV